MPLLYNCNLAAESGAAGLVGVIIEQANLACSSSETYIGPK